MRLITKKTITSFYNIHSTAKTRLEAFAKEIKVADWENPNDIFDAYPSADLIAGNRFVFNIKGNSFRLVADIEFRRKLVFIVWIGTHAEYDKIDVSKITHVKSD